MTREEYKQSDKWLKNHRINDGQIERLCSSCQTWKLENNDNFYYKNKKYLERGYSGECIECAKKRAMRYQKIIMKK